MDITHSKHNLRQDAKSQRKLLSMDEIEYFSIQIAEQVSTHFSFSNKKISCFLSMESQREVRTDQLLEALAPHNLLFVPVTQFNQGTMIQVPYRLGDVLQMNAYEIPEPLVQLYPIAPNDLDVVFIPLLQADQQGNRLGYGKGFYDRYLALCRPDVIKIGLNFFEPLAAIPSEETDIPLNYLITPTKVYEFK
ncbi:MAG: 5-formyltetrahydrofolate cyclo-ligase [Flavobacteriales bacterium]